MPPIQLNRDEKYLFEYLHLTSIVEDDFKKKDQSVVMYSSSGENPHKHLSPK
jgi:hypothetical protein